MSSTPFVSVIIAAFNCEKYVAKAIDSILEQTFSNFEILIADDGSSDQTREIIDKYSDPRIRRFHNDQNIGLVRTWNKLLCEAKGELITWQDADDTSHPQRLDKLVLAFQSDSELMLCGSNYFREFSFWKLYEVSDLPLTYEEITRIIQEERRVPFVGAVKMIRKDLLNKISGFRLFFDGLGWEDLDFILRVAEKYKVANIPDVLYNYRYNRQSSTKAYSVSSFLRLYMDKVGFFLSDQRRNNNGIDSLMDEGDYSSLQAFIEELTKEFDQDKSIVYRKRCKNKISNKDFSYAVVDACSAIFINPKIPSNYLLFLDILSNVFKTIIKSLLFNLLPGRSLSYQALNYK